jgi:DeoR/GlpR family transcriptional regulator of sugar metabolism
VVAVGTPAIDAIAQIRADTFFMGVTGIHPEAGLSTATSKKPTLSAR